MARWEERVSTNDIKPYADINNLKDGQETPYPNYALTLPRYSKLDGNFKNVSQVSTGAVGYISNSISNADEEFTTNPKITVEFSRVKTAGGVDFIFNQRSNDFPSQITINWYKDDELVDTDDYEPNSARFTALKEVNVFNKAEIIFKKTNKPYRPIFVAFVENCQITQTEGLKVIYYDTAYKGKQNTLSITGDNSSVGEYQSLLLENAIKHPKYSQTLPRYAKLDGNFINAPATISNMGFISNSISDANGDFATNPKITFTLSQKITSLGVSIYGNDASGDYCDEVNIKWYEDNTLLFSEDFEPNDVDYLCEKLVENYNKVVVEFIHTKKPYRNAYMRGFDYGVVRQFLETEITDCGAFMEIDPSSTELSINTMDFEIMNINNISFNFQRSQKCKLYFNKRIVGNFYLKKGSRDSEINYSFETEDFISILDENIHTGGIYNNVLAKTIIQDIFSGEDVELNIDSSFDSVRVTGYLPYDTKRNNLAQVCLAIGAIVDTSFDESIFIYPYETQTPHIISDKKIFTNTIDIEQGDVVTGVNLTIHSYTQNQTEKDLFNETLTGQVLVEFSEPMHSLTITGGTINSSGANYAYITGTGSTVVLKGKGYDHNEHIISMENTYARRDKKFIDVTDATLISETNGSTVLNRLYSYFVNNYEIKTDMLLEKRELGDIVTIPTFDGNKTGMITSIDMEFSNEIKAEVKIKCQDN